MHAEFRTWENIHSWGDIMLEPEKKVIKELLANVPRGEMCPYFGLIVELGNLSWPYCVARSERLEAAGAMKSDIPTPGDPRYQSHVSGHEIQLFCRGKENFVNCVVYKALEEEKNKPISPS